MTLEEFLVFINANPASAVEYGLMERQTRLRFLKDLGVCAPDRHILLTYNEDEALSELEHRNPGYVRPTKLIFFASPM